MTKYRVIHQQTEEGEILIDDIEQGLPNEPFGFLKKQQVYIPYNFKSFNVKSSGQVELNVDRSRPGFVDFVQTDDVRKSVSKGDISGLQDDNKVSVVDIQPGDLDPPSISSFTHDADGSQTNAWVVTVTVSDGSSATGDYTTTLNGTDFTASDTDAASDNSASLATDLRDAINGGSEPVTASKPSPNKVEIVADDLTSPFTHSVSTTDADGSISETVADTGLVVVEGSNFESTDPDVTSILLSDGTIDKEFTESEVESSSGAYFSGDVTETLIAVPDSLHGFGNTAGTLDSVEVTADTQTDRSGTVTEE